MSMFDAEVRRGERFEFGKNWQSFLSVLNPERIAVAEYSIKDMLEVETLKGKTVLDIGSGSGLFSLAARNLGATLHSFDYDPASVACAQELRARYYPDDPNWIIAQGSVLDEKFIRSRGSFDIVYSWGVLHHTGDMWRAIDNAALCVRENGLLFIALYNDQGGRSKMWAVVKKMYCSGIIGKVVMSGIFIPYFFGMTLVASLRQKENLFATYRKNRGMSIIHDWFDWLGGLPFEVATVTQVFRFLRGRGFQLNNIEVTHSLGCNQFVFTKLPDSTEVSFPHHISSDEFVGQE